MKVDYRKHELIIVNIVESSASCENEIRYQWFFANRKRRLITRKFATLFHKQTYAISIDILNRIVHEVLK